MNHKTEISYKDGSVTLAEDLGDLRYDALEEFLEDFAKKIEKDAAADLGRGRIKLSESLSATAAALFEAKKHMAEAWRISKPYMKEDGSC